MAYIETWEISEEFWNLVEPLIPASPRYERKTYARKPGGGRKRKYPDRLYFVVSGANRHDSLSLEPLLKGHG